MYLKKILRGNQPTFLNSYVISIQKSQLLIFRIIIKKKPWISYFLLYKEIQENQNLKKNNRNE